MSDISTRLMKVVALMFEVKLEELTPEMSIMDDLGADSLDAVELIMATEEEFGIEITDEQAEMLDTIGDCINMVRFHLREEEEEVEFPKPPTLRPVDLEGVDLQHNVEIATAAEEQFIATLAAGHVVECKTEHNSYKRALVRLGYQAALAIITAKKIDPASLGSAT